MSNSWLITNRNMIILLLGGPLHAIGVSGPFLLVGSVGCGLFHKQPVASPPPSRKRLKDKGDNQS